MTELYVTNSLNLNKTVKFNLTLRYFVIKGVKGEHVWVLELGTTHPAADGEDVPSKKVHRINADDLDDVIKDMVSELCTYIDWSPYVKDKEAPFVESTTPEDGTTVSIESNIYIILRELLPAAGIDLSEMEIILNNSEIDLDITDEVEVTGDPYRYQIFWKPPMRVYDTYE